MKLKHWLQGYQKKYMFVGAIISAGVVVFASEGVGQVPATNVSLPSSPSLPRRLNVAGLRLPSLDADDLVARVLANQQPVRAGRIADFAAERIVVGANASEALGDISARAFADQAGIGAELARLPAGALHGAAELVDEAYELPHSYVLSRAVRFTVTDPAPLAQKSELSALVAVQQPRRRDIRYHQLPRAQRKGMDDFIRNEARLLSPNDPLRLAAKQGREALLQAVRQGKGTYEIVDTIEIPKRPAPTINGMPQVHAFRNGVFDFNTQYDFAHPRMRSSLNFGISPRQIHLPDPGVINPEPPPLLPIPEEAVEGRHSFTSQFLAGFTKSKEWRWERRWNYPSGFFRATFGAGYRFGIRIPIEVSGAVSPERVRRRDARDRSDEVTSRIEVRTLDADAAFYRATGLSNDEVHEGREFLLGAYVLYGWKFRALWTDVIHQRLTTFEAGDGDANFRPPLGACGRECSVDVWIPRAATQTEWNVGVGSIGLDLGLRLVGDGRVSFDYESFVGDRRGRSKKLAFEQGRLASVQTATVPSWNETRAEHFGFRLEQPSYEVDLSMIPQLRVTATLDADWLDFRKTFRTRAVQLSSAKISLGEARFTHHAGTRNELVVRAGSKGFRKLEAPSFSVEDLRQSLEVGLVVAEGQRSSRNNRGKFLTSGGPGTGDAVDAIATSIDARARFRLVPVGDRRCVIQRHDGEYWRVTPQGIRAARGRDRATVFGFSFLERSGLHTLYVPGRAMRWVSLDQNRLTAARALSDAVRFRVWRAR